jgi:hypothetical protein
MTWLTLFIGRSRALPGFPGVLRTARRTRGKVGGLVIDLEGLHGRPGNGPTPDARSPGHATAHRAVQSRRPAAEARKAPKTPPPA